jgi:CXXX repeat modification system protein
MEVNCGKVSVAEMEEIKKLYQRRIALIDLFNTFQRSDPETIDKLYDRVIADLGKTMADYHDWWLSKSKQYHWQSSDKGSWKINFETCEIFLKVAD